MRTAKLKIIIFVPNSPIMRYTILTFFICLLLSCETTPKDSFQISGKAPNILNGMRAYLKAVNEQGRLVNKDTAIVIDEKFSFEGIRNEPNLEFLFIDGTQGNLPLIIENGAIEIAAFKDSLITSIVSGTPNNEKFQSFLKEQFQLAKKQRALMETLRNAPENANDDLVALNKSLSELPYNFINEHHDSYASVIILESKTYDQQAPLGKIESSFDALSNDLKTSSYGKRIKDFIATKKAEVTVNIGDVAPDFSGQTPDGNTLALSDIKGKVTIIDFWASWCGPCRRENPNVVKMYNKYHEKGLEIIGVSLDRSEQKDRWIQAIADDKLTWHHVSNLEFWQDPIARLYNIRSIPATFILNEQGEIVAKNLRGQELEDKVAELLN
jgi:peroxiredoxin